MSAATNGRPDRPGRTPASSTFKLAFELMRYRPWLFVLTTIAWSSFHAIPLVFGLVVGQVFGALAGEDVALDSPWTWVAVFAVFAVGRHVLVWIGEVFWIEYWNDQALRIRRNLLRWLLEADGSRVVTASPGEAISTFKDDVEDLLEYLENYVDGGGILIYAIGSVAIMASIDGSLTVALLVPLLLVVFIAQAMGPTIRARRRAMRLATEQVSGLIGETFGAVQSVKLAAAEPTMLAELHRRNEVRRRAALRDTFLTEALLSINVNMSNLTIGLVLLVSSAGLADGSLGVGQLVIFLTYLPRLTFQLAFVGHIIAQHRRTGVAYERIRGLAVDAADEELLDRTRIPLQGELGELPPRNRPDRDRLDRLEVSGLTFTYPDTDTDAGVIDLDAENGAEAGPDAGAALEPAGIRDISFTLERGSFTVLAGRVGAGKTTILRALLGLVPTEGEIRWNGRLIEDPASFLVPPRSAYTPQIPRLFSDTLAYNISLRERATGSVVHSAARLAVLDRDLDRLAAGIETMVGARGVKLSGGQIQRSAVARMFATEADLLVFDDLSSALDLHTEAELWERLFEHREATCLVISHRPAALERADQVLVVDGGRIVDRGRLGELLERSPVMTELWEAGGTPIQADG